MNTPQTPSSIYHLLASGTVIFLIPHLKTVRQHHQNGIVVFYLSLSKEHRFWQLLPAGSVILRVWELSGEVPNRIIYVDAKKRPVNKIWRVWLPLLMQRQQHKTRRNMKSQGNKTSLMECNNFQKLTPKDKEICDLPDKQVKIYYSYFKEVQRATRGTVQQNQGNIVNKIRNLTEEIIKRTKQIIQLKIQCMKWKKIQYRASIADFIPQKKSICEVKERSFEIV